MDTDPRAVKILCYGDSNTWGYIPVSEARYPVNARWTGLLQSKLGDGYWVVEEGLNGRTTNIEDPDSPGKHGLQYLLPCLKTHNPIDLVILMLGTNDTKYKFQRSPTDITSGIETLLREVKNTAWNEDANVPQILLLSPPSVDESVENAREEFAGAADKTAQLPGLYQRLAADYNAHFLDVSAWVKPSPKDGIHLEPADHLIIAEILSEKIGAIALR